MGAHAMHCNFDLAVRLENRKRILELIDHRRESECDAGIGWAIEQKILSDELLCLDVAMPEADGLPVIRLLRGR